MSYHMTGHRALQQRKETTMTNEVGSKIPANNGYGANGFQGASSDLPGKNSTAPAFLKPKSSDPIADVKAANVATFNEAERKHQEGNVPAGYGMRDRTSDKIVSVPHKTDRRDK